MIGSATLVNVTLKLHVDAEVMLMHFLLLYIQQNKDAALSERRNSVFARQLTLERIAKNVEKTIKPKNPEENKLILWNLQHLPLKLKCTTKQLQKRNNTRKCKRKLQDFLKSD